jgi:hypothetical protein
VAARVTKAKKWQGSSCAQGVGNGTGGGGGGGGGGGVRGMGAGRVARAVHLAHEAKPP